MRLASKKKGKVIGGSKFDPGEGSRTSNTRSSSAVKQGPTVQTASSMCTLTPLRGLKVQQNQTRMLQ